MPEGGSERRYTYPWVNMNAAEIIIRMQHSSLVVMQKEHELISQRRRQGSMQLNLERANRHANGRCFLQKIDWFLLVGKYDFALSYANVFDLVLRPNQPIHLCACRKGNWYFGNPEKLVPRRERYANLLKNLPLSNLTSPSASAFYDELRFPVAALSQGLIPQRSGKQPPLAHFQLRAPSDERPGHERLP